MLKVLMLLFTKLNISCIKSINNQNIDRGIPLCLSFSNVDTCIVEENENKYLIFTLTENNKEVLELYKKLWSEIIKQIKAINSSV